MAIVIILFIGFLLRLINLNQSLWLDETVQAITSKGSFLGIFTELRGDFHPPLYHLLMWGWAHLFGNSEIAMRLPSVIFGTATIYIIYLISKQIFNKKSSLPLILALFFATAPFHIYYSQEARTYAMTTFFAALSMYYFIRLIINHRPLAIAYILSTTLLLYSDYYGFFVFLAQIIAGMIILRKKITRLLLHYTSVFLLFLPCLPLLWIQLKTGSQATFSLPEWGRLVNLSLVKALPLTFIKFSIGRITIFNKTSYAAVAVILFLVYGGMILIGFRGQGLATSRKKNYLLDPSRQSLITILLWLFVPILLAWGISFFIPNYQPFRLLLVLPAFYLLLALGISGISSVKIRAMAIAFILLVNLISLGAYFKNPYFHREDWRGTVRFIEENGNQKTLALLPSYTSHWPYDYYSKGKVKLVTVGQEVKPVNENDLEKLSNSGLLSNIQYPVSIYYIYYLADLFDPQNLIPNWLESQNFVKIGEVSFNQIRIQEWQK